jgi:FlaG/FlaF family flagellin (archaellin)
VNGRPGYTASFEACDLSTTKKIGQFTITITGPGNFLYTKTSKVTKGSVKVRG